MRLKLLKVKMLEEEEVTSKEMNTEVAEEDIKEIEKVDIKVIEKVDIKAIEVALEETIEVVMEDLIEVEVIEEVVVVVIGLSTITEIIIEKEAAGKVEIEMEVIEITKEDSDKC